jgi:hypothetical protein
LCSSPEGCVRVRRRTPVKTCKGCGEAKPLTAFYVNRTSGDKTYRSSYCQPCHKVRHARWARARRYGLTPDELDALLGSARHCGICARDFTAEDSRWVHIDHDHATGIVRGVLCQWCNLLLGHSRENVDTLRAAIDYIERHGAA